MLANICCAQGQRTYTPDTQRQLPVPERQLGDIAEQIVLLKQLQYLLQATDRSSSEQQNSQNQTSGSPAMDAEQIRQLVDLVRKQSLSTPEGNGAFDTGAIPPELVNKLISDPEMRKMLQSAIESAWKDQQNLRNGSTRSLGEPFLPQQRPTPDFSRGTPSGTGSSSGLLDLLRNLQSLPRSDRERSRGAPNNDALNNSAIDQVNRNGSQRSAGGADLSQQVRQTGFWNTVQRVVENQRQRLNQTGNSTSSTSNSGGPRTQSPSSSQTLSNDLKSFSETLGKSLKNLGKGLEKKVKEVANNPRLRTPERTKKALTSNAPQTPKAGTASPPGANKANPSEIASAGSQANNGDSVAAPSQPTSSSSNASSPSTANVVASGGTYALAILAIVAGLSVAVWAIYEKLRGGFWNKTKSSFLKRFQLHKIHTRDELVRAYDQLVTTCPDPAPVWWTHRQAAMHLADQSPQTRHAFDVLLAIYEKARYYPDQFELSSQELRSAQDALEQCATCSMR